MISRKMLSFMIDKSGDDIYRAAFTRSLENFRLKNPAEMANNSGAVWNPEGSIISLSSLKQSIDVHFPEGRIVFTGSDSSPIWPWRLIILNYLHRADNTTLSNRLISYRELEGGNLFYPAFFRHSIKPLADKLSHESPERIERACLKLTDNLEKRTYICAVFSFLPKFPVTVKIWPYDEEIGGNANILFDAGANHYLHTEDIAAVGDIISGFLIKQCEQEPEPNTSNL